MPSAPVADRYETVAEKRQVEQLPALELSTAESAKRMMRITLDVPPFHCLEC